MSKQFFKNINFLSLLVSAEDEQRVAIIKSMSEDQFKVLVECVYNILYGVITLSPQYKKKLFKYRNVIRKITEQGRTRLQRKKLLLKYRFLLPTLVKIVLSQVQ